MKTCNCHWIQALKGRDSGEEQRDELCQVESWKQEVAENWTGTRLALGIGISRGRGGCSGDEFSGKRFVGAASRSDTEE